MRRYSVRHPSVSGPDSIHRFVKHVSFRETNLLSCWMREYLCESLLCALRLRVFRGVGLEGFLALRLVFTLYSSLPGYMGSGPLRNRFTKLLHQI